MARRVTLLVALVLLVPFTASADTSFSGVSVPATTNIFTAGGNADPLACCSNGPSTAAVLAAAFPPAGGQVLTISSATGNVGCAGAVVDGADGPCFTMNTDVTGLGTVSGIQAANNTLFLVGAFLDNGLPGSAPSTLNYDGAILTFSQPTYSPQIGQVFFIGDGLTGTGTGRTQEFSVPPTATRLYLGFADSYDFNGPPGYYGDNVGSLTVSGSIRSVAVPALSLPLLIFLALVVAAAGCILVRTAYAKA